MESTSVDMTVLPDQQTAVIALGTTLHVLSACSAVTRVNDNQMIRALACVPRLTSEGLPCFISGGDGKMIHVYTVSYTSCAGAGCENDEDDSTVVAGEAARTIKKSRTEHTTGSWSTRHAVTRCFQYGPHTKRITHVAACHDTTVVFADKFGEVYRISLPWAATDDSHTSISSADGSAAHTHVDVNATVSRATFVLQHFSVISALLLDVPAHLGGSAQESVGGLGRRLITCDKDSHIRVSRFSDTCRIESYLWPSIDTIAMSEATPHPNVVTCLTAFQPSFDHHGCKDATYYALGSYDGRVYMFSGCPGKILTDSEGTTNSSSNKEDDSTCVRCGFVFHEVGVIARAPAVASKLGTAAQKEDGAKVSLYAGDQRVTASCTTTVTQSDTPVVGLAYVATGTNEAIQGLLVAYDRSYTLSFTPLHSCSTASSNSNEECAHDHVREGRLCLGDAAHVVLQSPAAAMTVCASDAVLVLQRNGTVVRVSLVAKAVSSSSIGAKLHVDEVHTPSWYTGDLAAPVEKSESACARASNKMTSMSLRSLLESVDLFALWRHEAVDPRTRRANADAESGNDEE